MTKFEGAPCNLLRADQLSSPGVSKAGTSKQGASGPQCDWKTDDRLRGTDFGAVVMKNSNGLDGLYENKSSYPVFNPGQVAGYPSVDSDITDGAHGACFTSVGTAKGTGFTVNVFVNNTSAPEYKNPCSVSSKIAEIVVGNLKG